MSVDSLQTLTNVAASALADMQASEPHHYLNPTPPPPPPDASHSTEARRSTGSHQSAQDANQASLNFSALFTPTPSLPIQATTLPMSPLFHSESSNSHSHAPRSVPKVEPPSPSTRPNSSGLAPAITIPSGLTQSLLGASAASLNPAALLPFPMSLPPGVFNVVLPMPLPSTSNNHGTSSGCDSPVSESSSALHGGGSVDGDTLRELLKEQNVKKQRLARKAELARMSRKRKKNKLCDLEQEVAALKAELEKERKSRKVAENCLAITQQQARLAAAVQESDTPVSLDSTLTEEAKRIQSQLRQQLSSSSSSSGSDEKELSRLASDLVGIVKKQETHSAQQVKNLSRVLTPSLQLRFVEWALSQKDPFYQDGSGLWNSLFVREVGLSDVQLSALMNLRSAIQQQRAAAQETQSTFSKLSQLSETRSSLATESLNQFVSVFTPQQLAKFFNWVDTYGQVCVQINV